ncbi:unnamed protein product [Caenorhabditis sp. 36 PRJEB53466]|nr:unnamed protein product [Caenorhabditis sp. 36 PRJEB53466]
MDDDEVHSNPEKVPPPTLFERESAERRSGRKSKAKKSDSYESYSPADIIAFIKMIEAYPVIWDSGEENYHRKEVKLRIFDQLEQSCSRFMPRGRQHGACAMERWKELNADYTKHVLKIQKAPSGSGTTSSTFPYATHMAFLDVARSKRSVQNSFVVGTDDVQIIGTPKRKMEDLSISTSKRKKTGMIDIMLAEMKATNEQIASILIADSSTDNGNGPSCKSSRICKVFDQHVRELSEIERYESEAAVVSFIGTLSRRHRPRADLGLNSLSDSFYDSPASFPSSSSFPNNY